MTTKSEECVLILMACFNGEKYLSDQLDSIINQSYQNWRLIIRDDCSFDGTLPILQEYALKDGRISIVTGQKNVGSVQNFSLLLNEVTDEKYILFADQDDFWLPEKIARYVAVFSTLEPVENKPVLLYSNLSYVDEHLNPLNKEIRFSIPEKRTLNLLLFQNWMYGCTMMLNNKLAKMARDIPMVFENHDYWVAMIAVSMGKVIHEDASYILYRQHGKNISGQHNQDTFMNRFKRIVFQHGVQKRKFANKYIMIEQFYSRFKDLLPSENKSLIGGFIDSIQKTGTARLYYALRNGIRNPGQLQSIMTYFYLLMTPPTKK